MQAEAGPRYRAVRTELALGTGSAARIVRPAGAHARPVHELAGLQIRYLDLDASRMAPLNRGLPVAALVFPRYQAGAPLEQQRMTATEALAGLCHARSPLDREPDFLAQTLRWVEAVPAYRLTFGELDHAIEWVLSLLAVE